MMKRRQKQAIIAFTYIAVTGLFAYWVYNSFVKALETCFDGVKNQNEIVIDKGGVCGAYEDMLPAAALQITETTLVYGGVGRSDVLVKIYNPNDRYGASKFTYTVFARDASGNIMAQKKDTGYILPKETKYLLQMGMETSSSASGADVIIDDAVEWQVFAGYREKPIINVYSKRYGPAAAGVGFGQVDGTLSNESGFDFQVLTVNIVLRDAAGKPVAVNKTEMRTVIAGERRDIGPLVFPAYFPGEVSAVETEAEVDMYRSDNFIRKYLPGGAFQRF